MRDPRRVSVARQGVSLWATDYLCGQIEFGGISMEEPDDSKSDGRTQLAITIDRDGELFENKQTWIWCEACQIDTGELILPITLQSDDAKEWADLAAINSDLGFAKVCFSKALEAGPEKQGSYRAFVNAGLMSYARAFDKGRRSTKLHPEQFPHWPESARKLHDHLFALRQKHVAHSVNEYEYCDPIGVIVLDKNRQRKMGLIGFGVISLMAVGMSDAMLKGAIELVDDISGRVNGRADTLGRRVYAALKEHLDGGGAWEISPVARLPQSATKIRTR